MGGYECEDLAFRLAAAQFGENVGIEKPTAQKRTSRTGMAVRLGSISISRCGEACMAAIKASPVRSPLRRRNSSAEMTTTSSRPCTVTRCGPSLRTRRTSSLKRAFASCNGHWPDFGRRARRRGLVGFAGVDFAFLVILTRISYAPGNFNGRLSERGQAACRRPAFFRTGIAFTKTLKPSSQACGVPNFSVHRQVMLFRPLSPHSFFATHHRL